MLNDRIDRRAHERFDVVGTLWGVLELPEPARLMNISVTGALIDAPLGPVLGSLQSLRMTIEGECVRVDARVRHVRHALPGRFLVGLEFVAPPTSVIASIEALDSQESVEDVEIVDDDPGRS